MADELEILLHYESEPNIKICPRCEVENPKEGRICFLCGTDLSKVIAAAPVIPNIPKPTPETDVSFNLHDEAMSIMPAKKDSSIAKTILGVVILVVLVTLGLLLINTITHGEELGIVQNEGYEIEQMIEVREKNDL